MAEPRTVAFDDLESLVGEHIGYSDWHEIDQERINLFADATDDHQWIHVDVDRATQMFGSTIAHGYLTVSLVPKLASEVMKVSGVTRGINYGSNKVRFTSMVPVGSKVRMSQSIKSVEPKAGGKQMITECTIEIDGQERPACVAEIISVLYA